MYRLWKSAKLRPHENPSCDGSDLVCIGETARPTPHTGAVGWRGRIIYCGYSQNFCEHVPRSHIVPWWQGPRVHSQGPSLSLPVSGIDQLVLRSTGPQGCFDVASSWATAGRDQVEHHVRRLAPPKAIEIRFKAMQKVKKHWPNNWCP